MNKSQRIYRATKAEMDWAVPTKTEATSINFLIGYVEEQARSKESKKEVEIAKSFLERVYHE